jgi:hypothetical protein
LREGVGQGQQHLGHLITVKPFTRPNTK